MIFPKKMKLTDFSPVSPKTILLLKNKSIVFFLLTSMLSGTSVFSQNKQKLDSVIMEDVIIQGNRLQIPLSEQNRNVTVINAKTIKTMPVRSVEELLSFVAGIDIRRRGVMGTQADIGINGGTFEETLVLLNGVKIIDPQTGHNMLNIPVSLDAIERIEIVKGSAASVYGINAINGAVNIITKQPAKTGLHVHSFIASSFEKDSISDKLYTGGGLNLNASLTGKNSRHFLALSTVQSNGYRYNTSVNNKKIFYSNHFDFGENSLEMMGGYVNNEFGANAFYAAPVDKDAKEAVKTVIASVQGKLKITDWWDLKPGISYRYGSDHFILDKYNPGYYQNLHYTNVFEANLNNTFHTKIGVFGFGTTFRNAKINSNSLGEHTRNNFGLFGNYHFSPLQKTTINLGAYVNHNDTFGWNFMPSIDAGYQVNNQIRLYANAGTGMRIPSFTDLYYTGPVNVGNKDLKPEKAWQTAVGLKYHTNKFYATAEYFYRNTDDFIDWVKDSIDDPWQSRNYQRIKMEGVSLSADYQLISQKNWSDFGLQTGISYTYLSPKVETSNTNLYSHYALGNLKHQLAGRVFADFGKIFSFTLAGKYQKRISSTDYFLLDARLAATIADFQLYLDGSNLTNITYTEAAAAPMPGRWISLGVKWEWWKK